MWSMLSLSFEQCIEVLCTDELSRMGTDGTRGVQDHVPFGPTMVQNDQPFFFTELLILAVSRRPYPTAAALFEDEEGLVAL